MPTTDREVHLIDLRYLLSFKKLDVWGMEALTDTLLALIPELAQNLTKSETFHDCGPKTPPYPQATPAEITDQTGNTPNCNTE